MAQPSRGLPLTFTCTPFPGPTPRQFSTPQGCPWAWEGSHLRSVGMSTHPECACPLALGWGGHSPGCPVSPTVTASGSVHTPGYESRGTLEVQDNLWAPATVILCLLHTQITYPQALARGVGQEKPEGPGCSRKPAGPRDMQGVSKD